MMNDVFGSSGSFGSIDRSEFISNNIYTGGRIKFRSKSIPIHLTVHK